MIQIENYISSFLLKNKYCAISGLGTLELKREPAYSADNGTISPPNYNITFSPIGVIDDGFATFIANHENVSISKASNDIKTFSQEVKHELHKTGRFEIDGVGYFTHKNDIIQFHQDETLDLERDPIQLYREKTVTEEDEETLADAKSFKDLNYTHSEKGIGKPKMGTLLKYLLAFLLLIGLAAIAYFGYKYFESNRTQATQTEEAAMVEDYDDVEASDTAGVNNGTPSSLDSSETVGIVDNPPVEEMPPAAVGEYKIAVQAFDSLAIAQAKSEKLNSWENKTTVITRGAKHYLVIYATTPSGDTLKLKDSIRRHFNPSGEPFMVK